MESKNLAAALYDTPDLAWNDVEATLAAGLTQAPGTGGPDRHTCWLATIDADGRPHVTGMGALWAEGAFWIETGRTTRKGRNLERDPRCTISLALHDYDVVVEADGALVTDPDVVAARAAEWAPDWPCRVDDSGIALTAEFSAPSAGPPPWHVYRLSPTAATVLQTVEPGGAMRFRF